VSYGAAINAVDDKGSSALWYAAQDGNLDLVCFLVEVGAKCGASDDRGNTELHVAPSAEILRRLLRAGGNVNSRNNQGATPMHTAALMEEVYISWKDESGSGRNVFSKASVMKSLILTLVQAGADVEAVDNLGRTALEWVRESENTNAIEILIQLRNGVQLPKSEGRATHQ
jgi:ankyrin repeat protein